MISLVVNGKEPMVDVSLDTLLLYVLRNDLTPSESRQVTGEVLADPLECLLSKGPNDQDLLPAAVSRRHRVWPN